MGVWPAIAGVTAFVAALIEAAFAYSLWLAEPGRLDWRSTPGPNAVGLLLMIALQRSPGWRHRGWLRACQRSAAIGELSR